VAEKRWTSLKELSGNSGRSLSVMVDDLKGFDIADAQITAWLGQKEKMISFLGPLAAEPVMVRNQIQQLEVTVIRYDTIQYIYMHSNADEMASLI